MFKSVFSTQILHPGSPLMLKCSAEGDPMPQIRWFLYSRPLSDHHEGEEEVDHHESLMKEIERGKRFRIGDFLDSKGVIISYVNVTSLTSHDGGVYTCQAFSESGSSTHSALIQVYGPPSVHGMDNLTVVTGSKLQVDCPYSGYPIQDIRWQKGKKILLSLSFCFFSLLSLSERKRVILVSNHQLISFRSQMKMNESNEKETVSEMNEGSASSSFQKKKVRSSFPVVYLLSFLLSLSFSSPFLPILICSSYTLIFAPFILLPLSWFYVHRPIH